MIRIYADDDRTADIFALATEETALVSPVDCSGAQGAGLALAIRRRWPAAGAWFKAQARAQGVEPGTLLHFTVRDGPTVLFFPTKRHWQEDSTLEVVQAGLAALPQCARVMPRFLTRIAIPALGCGEGRLTWEEVRPRVEAIGPALEAEHFDVHLFPPQPWRAAPRRRPR